MGKKYEFLKEQLKQNPVRDLLVINDRLIRQKYFAEANDVIVKIDVMEGKIKDFHSKDQKLFDEWYKLTFREDQKSVDQAQTEFRALARFHNWIVAMARMLDIGMAEAFGLIKEEEERYQHGSADEREEIEKERQERDSFIESDAQERYNEEPDSDSRDESENENGAHLGQILSHLEDLILKEDREPGLDMQSRIDRIMTLSDEEFQYWLKDQEVAFLMFDISLSWGESQFDYSFFLRVWKLMSKTQKRTFSEVYYSLTGHSIEALVRRFGGEKEEDESEDEEFNFRDEFIDDRRQREYQQKISALEEEKLKGLYRKLIRKLHPDLQAAKPSEHQIEWIKRIWNSVQKAYNSRDVSALERLFSLTLLRMNDLDQLTLDEIQQARRWLEKDLKNLESEARHLKKSMAWGFSSKKDYSTLTRKIKREFQDTIETVRYQIEEIQKEHRILELLFGKEGRTSQPNSRRKKLKKKKTHRSRHFRRDRDYDDNQESFSFD